MAGEMPAAIGPYTILGELGRGGMGVVYHARRNDLKREFALKVIRAAEQDEADALARFRREAQAAAALSGHPGIVGVHDIGDDGGRVYFAMDLVDGPSLEQTIDGGELLHAQAAEWLEQAARAVHHAHQRGVLHRDLKPGNILIGSDGRARVTDFGLAQVREAGPDVTRLTKSGVVLGTPAYMPPEQASGGAALDARADVYALGAALYECLVGEPPFTGETMLAVLGRVMREEARPAVRRDPRVPAALSVIAAKCLEKDPQRRYQTAEALAEDLARWRRGEPILARPPSPAFRARRWAARNRALAVAAVAVVVALGAFWAYGAAQRQAVSAEQAVLQQLRERTGLALRAALSLRRAGQLDAMDEYLAETERACRESEAQLAGHPEPHFRLGQMYRALGRWDEALAAQNRALELDPAHRGALYERVVLRFGAHGRRTRELVTRAQREAGRAMFSGGAGAQVERAPERRAAEAELARSDAVAAALRAGLLEDLQQLAAAGGAGEISDGALLCARGLHALLEERHADARRMLEEAVAAEPALVAPYEALAEMARNGGDFEASGDWWGRGIDADRGYLPFLVGRLTLFRRAAGYFAPGDPRVKQYLDRAEADARRLLELRDDPAAHAELGMVRWERARRLEEDPRARAGHYEASLQSLQAALQKDPANARLLEMTANTQRGLGFARMKGEAGTPLPHLADAIATYTRALGLPGGPENVELWHGRAVARRDLAEWLLRGGRDPGTLLEDAQTDLDEAVRLDPSLFVLWTGRAQLHIARATRAADEGRDPRALYDAGIRDVREALRLNDGNPFAWWMLGRLQLGQTQYLHNEQRAATREAFEEAVASFRRAVTISPKDTTLWGTLADGQVALAKYHASTGSDPRAILRAAVASYDEALQLNEALAGPWSGRGRARTRLAVEESDRGGDAGQLIQQAASDIRRAIAIEPKRPRLWQELGDTYRTHAGLEPRGSNQAISALQQARESLDRAVELSGGVATDVLMTRAMVLVDTCLHWTPRGRDITELVRAAEEDIAAVLKIGETVQAYEIRARARMNWGGALAGRRQDPTGAYEGAVADGKRAVEISPNSADGWSVQGEAQRYLADRAKFTGRAADARPLYEEAIRCYGEAIKIASRSGRDLQGRGAARVNFANLLRDTGGEPGPQYQEAIDDLTLCVQVAPGNGTSWWFLANAHGGRGMWLARTGGKPIPDFEAAIQAFEGAIRAAPHMRPTFEKGIAGYRARIAKAQGK